MSPQEEEEISEPVPRPTPLLLEEQLVALVVVTQLPLSPCISAIIDAVGDDVV